METSNENLHTVIEVERVKVENIYQAKHTMNPDKPYLEFMQALKIILGQKVLKNYNFNFEKGGFNFCFMKHKITSHHSFKPEKIQESLMLNFSIQID